MARKRKEPEAPPPAPDRRPPPGVWPDEIPILTEEDLCRKTYHHTDGLRHDLIGWLETAFDCRHNAGPMFNPCYRKAERALVDVLGERGAEDLSLGEIADAVDRFSDAFLCAAWNEMLDRVGYDIPQKLRRWPRKEE